MEVCPSQSSSTVQFEMIGARDRCSAAKGTATETLHCNTDLLSREEYPNKLLYKLTSEDFKNRLNDLFLRRIKPILLKPQYEGGGARESASTGRSIAEMPRQ